MGLSVLFLLSYVAYHFTSNEVKFGDLNLDGIVDEAERARSRRHAHSLSLRCWPATSCSQPSACHSSSSPSSRDGRTVSPSTAGWRAGSFRCGSTWPSPDRSATGCCGPIIRESPAAAQQHQALPTSPTARCPAPESPSQTRRNPPRSRRFPAHAGRHGSPRKQCSRPRCS